MNASRAAEELEPYLRAMLEENEHLNLTAIRDLLQARVLHVLDSLAIARFDLQPTQCLDLGSGNGFPGVALRVLYPAAEVTLMERTAKKVRAIRHILDRSELPDVTVLQLDAEQAPRTHEHLAGHFDLVTARAVGPAERVARLAAPLLAPGGSLVLWIGAEAERPGELPGFVFLGEAGYELPEPARRERCVLRYGRTGWDTLAKGSTRARTARRSARRGRSGSAKRGRTTRSGSRSSRTGRPSSS